MLPNDISLIWYVMLKNMLNSAIYYFWIEIHSNIFSIYYCIYMESRKLVQMNLFAGRNRDTDVENRLVDFGERESGRIWERRTDMYTQPCIKQLVGSC